ncbi:MAG: OsmC family protein [Bacteroidota bacterium]|nr:OsmC family protein [Bacteroidota bacterium]
MATVTTLYSGSLRTEATHEQSGTVIITDAPLDNHGRGEAFSPTDLLAASLGSCMITLIGISAKNHGFNIDGTKVSITKFMAANPRRVSAIEVILDFPQVIYEAKIKNIIEKAALTCPVAVSLHPDIEQRVIFNFFK